MPLKRPFPAAIFALTTSACTPSEDGSYTADTSSENCEIAVFPPEFDDNDAYVEFDGELPEAVQIEVSHYGGKVIDQLDISEPTGSLRIPNLPYSVPGNSYSEDFPTLAISVNAQLSDGGSCQWTGEFDLPQHSSLNSGELILPADLGDESGFTTFFEGELIEGVHMMYVMRTAQPESTSNNKSFIVVVDWPTQTPREILAFDPSQIEGIGYYPNLFTMTSEWQKGEAFIGTEGYILNGVDYSTIFIKRNEEGEFEMVGETEGSTGHHGFISLGDPDSEDREVLIPTYATDLEENFTGQQSHLDLYTYDESSKKVELAERIFSAEDFMNLSPNAPESTPPPYINSLVYNEGYATFTLTMDDYDSVWSRPLSKDGSIETSQDAWTIFVNPNVETAFREAFPENQVIVLEDGSDRHSISFPHYATIRNNDTLLVYGLRSYDEADSNTAVEVFDLNENGATHRCTATGTPDTKSTSYGSVFCVEDTDICAIFEADTITNIWFDMKDCSILATHQPGQNLEDATTLGRWASPVSSEDLCLEGYTCQTKYQMSVD